jgi:hypothetical protein
MDVATAMKALEAAGSESTRKTYTRHGVTGPQFGVSYAALGKLAKQAGTDSALAVELWKSGNHDARILATMVADGRTLALADLDLFGREVTNKVIADAVGRLAARVPSAKETILGWTKSPDEWIGRAGWMGIAAMVAEPGLFDEAELDGFISSLEKGIHRTKNHVKDARLCLLISIGGISDALEVRALAVARRIGPIDVDHGDTACETPDPLTYIPKTRAHRRAKEQKASREKKPATSAAAKSAKAKATKAPASKAPPAVAKAARAR